MTKKPIIIGITGNIATGKSVLQRMLANSGAFGIDADVIAHRMLYPGGPAYQIVIDTFGTQILTKNKEISNQKLGEIVFADSKRLDQLEEIVHPLVIDAIHRRVKASHSPVVVIEAIKLLESGLADFCDQIWVSHASFTTQLQRLVETRGMSEAQARARISLQPPQNEKCSRADVIIKTEGSYQETWQKTQRALNDTIELLKSDNNGHINIKKHGNLITVNNFSVSELEKDWQSLSGKNVSSLYKLLGMKRVFPVTIEDKISAFVIWNSWNFTATLENVCPTTFFESSSSIVYSTFEEHARSAQTEFILLSNNLLDSSNSMFSSFGLTQSDPEDLTYPAWKTAAIKAATNDSKKVWLKVLTKPFN